jgi:hypothetical protein
VKNYKRSNSIGEQEEIELFGLSAIQREEFLVGRDSILATYFKKDSLIFKFSLYGTRPFLHTVTDEDRELNNQILSTFRFLE